VHNFKKRVMSAALGGVMAASIVLVGGSPAAAATCPSVAEPVITGAKAKWTLECYRGDLKVYGWLEDTRLDGKCAEVTVDPYPGDTRRRQACGFNTRENFDITVEDETSAYVTLSLRD